MIEREERMVMTELVEMKSRGLSLGHDSRGFHC